MRKTELTKGQQKKFKWLMDADTKNEDVKVSKFGYLIWKGGTWEDGIWDRGTWENGTWECGVWEDGTWEYGIWKGGVWEDGFWEDGIWKDGIWEDGIWKGGTWEWGVWMGGFMWSNLKHKYIHVEWDEDKKEFEEDLK